MWFLPSALQLYVECGEGLHSYEVVHYTGCVAVVRAVVELADGGVLKLLVPAHTHTHTHTT